MSTVDNRAEIAEKLRAIRERIRRRLGRPAPQVPELLPLPLDSVKQAQAAANSLTNAIGTLNPRPPGLANNLIQTGKKSLARLLDWHVRPQRDFNRTMVESLERVSEVLQAANRNLAALRESSELFSRCQQELGREMDSLGDHFERCQQELGREMDSLGGYFEEQMKLQRWTLEGELMRQSTALRDRVGELAAGLQAQQEEMRLVRQRVAAQSRTDSARAAVGSLSAQTSSPATRPPAVDYFQLERHFRGTEEEIRTRQSFYVPFFRGRQNVLDIACGRGEFLELMRQEGIPARGVDLDVDMVGRCLEKGLDAVQAEAFAYLETISDGSRDGIFCAQFVEHLVPEAYMRLVAQCAAKLMPSGVLAIETQNPECLAIFSQTFFLDPTHVRPIPPAQLRFLFAEAGLVRITTHFLAPAAAGLPLVPKLESRVIEPESLRAWNAAVGRFNETFFGGMDYAIIGYRADSGPKSSAVEEGTPCS